MDEQIDERRASAFELGAFELFGWNFSDDVLEGFFGGVANLGAEKYLAGLDRSVERGLAVNEAGDFAGEGAVGFARAGVGDVFGFEFFDLGAWEQGEFFQVLHDHAILGVDEELVEFVRAGFLRIEPDGAAFGFTELRAIAFCDEREGEAPRSGFADFLADEVSTGGDVAPLVRTADLELAFVLWFDVQVIEIVSLQELVAEFGVADPGAAFHARADAVLGDHDVDRKIFSDVAQKIEVADAAGPVGVVDEASGIGRRAEVEQARELVGDRADVVLELFTREEIALGGFTRRIADHAGGSTGKGERVVAGELKTAQHQLAHEMPDVEGIAGGIEAAIQCDRSLSEALGERFFVGAVGDEAAPLEVFEEIHGRARKTRCADEGKVKVMAFVSRRVASWNTQKR